MLSFKKNSKDSSVGNAATITQQGIVFSVKEVEALMAEAENIAMNLKTRIAGASQVIFKNLQQEHQFETFTESIRSILDSTRKSIFV